MEGFTLFDAIAVGVIVLSSLLAYGRGLIREMMAIIGWVGSAYLAYLYAPLAQPLVLEIPFVGDFLAGSCELAVIASFALVFVLGLAVASLFAPLLSSYIQRTFLSSFDQALGLFFGAVRGLVLLAVVLIVYERAFAQDAVAMIDTSTTARLFANVQENMNNYLPDDAPSWLIARYQSLIAGCAATPQNV